MLQGRLSSLPSCNLASFSSSEAIFYLTTFIGHLRYIIGALLPLPQLYHQLSHYPTHKDLIRIQASTDFLLLGLSDLPADEVSDALRQDHVTAVDR